MGCFDDFLWAGNGRGLAAMWIGRAAFIYGEGTGVATAKSLKIEQRFSARLRMKKGSMRVVAYQTAAAPIVANYDSSLSPGWCRRRCVKPLKQRLS
jgi:hypothetical protein